MPKKLIKGTCSICAIKTNLTFEHIPPEKAGNTNAVYIQDQRHLLPTNQYLSGKKIRSHRGMGDYKTCEDCNNKTGQWYAKEYINFYNSFITNMNTKQDFHNENGMLFFQVSLKPLNVLKQILVHHLCADQGLGWIQRLVAQTNFILNKDENNLSNKIRVFMYATSSSVHRIQGMSIVASEDLRTLNNYSEFSFHPFGTLLTIDSIPPAFPPFMEITNFKEFKFDESTLISFRLPHIEIKTAGAGYYP